MSLFDTAPILATPGSSSSQLSGSSVESTMGQSLGMNASQVGMEYTQNMLNVAPTLTQKNGYTFNVVLPSTIVFNGYYSLVGDQK